MDNLKIGVIGTGYVGLITGVGFAKLGFKTTCLDIDQNKIDMINNAIPPIYENGLENLLDTLVNSKNPKFTATTNRELFLKNSNIIFICLPTPNHSDGSINMEYILNELKEIGSLTSNDDDYKIFIIKSSVVPGSTNGIIKQTLETYSKKLMNIDFGLAVNPEFLMEGSALNNFFNPDRIIIGSENQKIKKVLIQLYATFECQKLFVSLDEAEMIKYVSNSFLATKISFINEIANLSENFNINMDNIVKGISLDHRISPYFLRSGLGFGGSCFPKDLLALYSLGKIKNQNLNLIESVIKVNSLQPLRVIEILNNHIDPMNKKIGILGLTFKPNTDDLREAPSLKICEILHELGSHIYAYDPMYTDKKIKYDYIKLCDQPSDVIKDSHAIIIATEWDEFKDLNPLNFTTMKLKLIIDGRRILNLELFKNTDISLFTIGNGYLNPNKSK